MSLRAFGGRLFRNGTAILRSYCKREFNTNKIAEEVKPVREPAVVPRQIAARNFALRNVGAHARRLFIDSVLNRVTNSLAADLRRSAARRMLFGDSGPFFAFVGISLASGTGILTKEDELERMCVEIRNAVSKINWNAASIDVDEERFKNEKITLKSLQLGQPIEKGCSAVVYAAQLIDSAEASHPNKENEDTVHANVNITENSTEINAEIKDSLTGYPLAVKMMFNYDIQSSAMAILRAMYRETVPARAYYNPMGVTDWESDIASRTIHLSPHPNIITMYSVFADYVPQLLGAKRLYPAALPTRLYAEGSGRNMSLFLLMKRYDCSLQKYLTQFEENHPSTNTSLLLFAQLLEAIVHINMQGVAHRDLKSDNILLDLQEDGVPILVLTDFGCCLADKINGLHLPYNSYEIDRGGNTALMAPEVLTRTPGTFTVINYTKSDVWAAGAIAYEIFGLPNPFYSTEINGKRLQSATYKEEDLPSLPDHVPVVIRLLVGNLLHRNPKKRLDPETAANVCHLLLWAPSDWLKANTKLPSSTELLQWLLCLTTKVLCESRLLSGVVSSNAPPQIAGSQETNVVQPLAYTAGRGRRTYPEYLLISSFLRRAKLTYIRSALTWIHNTI